MQMTSIASGSSGNCTYISSEHNKILVDAGISCKRICEGLRALGTDASELDGIFITHEHSDHIQGLRILSKKYELPIFGTKETLAAIQTADTKGEIGSELYHPIDADVVCSVGGLTVLPFHNTHDAANPVGYRIEDGRHAVAIATDLGNYSQYTIRHLLHLDALLIEANHDVHMLEAGSYPYALKRRILSDYGHLSNDCCGQLLCELLHDNLKAVLLGHLSRENNYEALAYETVCLAINESPIPYRSSDFPIQVAKRDGLSETISLT